MHCDHALHDIMASQALCWVKFTIRRIIFFIVMKLRVVHHATRFCRRGIIVGCTEHALHRALPPYDILGSVGVPRLEGVGGDGVYAFEEDYNLQL